MSNDKTPTEITTIVSQLGGNRIYAMAFKQLVYATRPHYEATFHVAKALVKGTRGKATHVVITLIDDLYTVKTVRVAKFDVATVEEVAGVYAAQLRATVEQLTGLALSL